MLQSYTIKGKTLTSCIGSKKYFGETQIVSTFVLCKEDKRIYNIRLYCESIVLRNQRISLIQQLFTSRGCACAGSVCFVGWVFAGPLRIGKHVAYAFLFHLLFEAKF